MLSYDDLVNELEEAWVAAGLHEHAIVESIVPAVQDRTYRAELFPDHSETLTEATMPPWVELSFTWSAIHQIRSEGRAVSPDAFEISWLYTITSQTMQERSDQELVRMFQRTAQAVFRRFYPVEEVEPPNVEVRRIYQNEGTALRLGHIQLVSLNVTDLTDQWSERNPHILRHLVRTEMQLAKALIDAMSETFAPNGRGGYRTVDTA